MNIDCLKELHCLRCEHHWFPRKPGNKICPSCKSHLWWKEKKFKQEKLNVQGMSQSAPHTVSCQYGKEDPDKKEKLNA